MVIEMYKNCEWLPELIKLDTEIDDEIIEILYNIFSTDIYGTTLYYKGKEVRFRREPMWKGKEEGFFHLISDKNLHGKEYYTLNIDRARRLLWGKAIIEHEPCRLQSIKKCCKGVYNWSFTYIYNKYNNERVKLLHSEYRYLVILEERADYWLFITGYYIENGYKFKELKKEYIDSLKHHKI